MTNAPTPTRSTIEEDPNVKEIRAIRAANSARANYDVDAYFEELKRFEKQHLRARHSDAPPSANGE